MLQAMHIGQLPVEVIQYILKWVISSDLDIYSLDQLSCVSSQQTSGASVFVRVFVNSLPSEIMPRCVLL